MALFVKFKSYSRLDAACRRFRNLRISLTAACNYACTYCVPDGKRLVAAQDELSADSLARAVEYLVEAAGIERLRITGGEPLVSPRLDAFLRQISRLGLSDISLTSNGENLLRSPAQASACSTSNSASLINKPARRARADGKAGAGKGFS